jgi:chorismate mutase/prephenate dehydratase
MSDSKKEADDLRRRMADTDLEILKLLERRAKCAKDIGRLGLGAQIGFNQERERLNKLDQSISGELGKDSVRSVFRSIFAACSPLEGPARVAYVGTEGSLGYVAARAQFGASISGVGFETPAQALDELTRGRADFAVTPYETSIEGPVLSTIAALRQTDLMIIGQCELPGGLSVLSRTGNLADVEKVYVTALERARCLGFLNAKLPKVSVIDVRSPLMACQLASEDHGSAAIAHESLGDSHDLSVVLSNVGDNPDLRVRYAVIGTRPSPRTGQDVTSIVFTVNDEPGALLGVLGHFAERGVNLKNIMSRPVPGEAWDYLFYIEIVGHATDRAIVSALDGIKKNTKFVKVLGSYPMNP